MRSTARRNRRRANNRPLVVSLERPNAPVRFLKHSRVLSDVLLARVHAAEPSIHGAARARVCVTAQVAAEGVCEDEALVHEALVDVAAGASEVGDRSAELRGVGRAGRETLGRAATGEEPDLDALGLPFGYVVAALGCVEPGAVGSLVTIADTAAEGAGRAVEGTVVAGLLARLSEAIDLAVSVGVEI